MSASEADSDREGNLIAIGFVDLCVKVFDAASCSCLAVIGDFRSVLLSVRFLACGHNSLVLVVDGCSSCSV